MEISSIFNSKGNNRIVHFFTKHKSHLPRTEYILNRINKCCSKNKSQVNYVRLQKKFKNHNENKIELVFFLLEVYNNGFKCYSLKLFMLL